MVSEEKYQTENPREAAFHALLMSHREEGYIDHYLSRWSKTANLDPRDYQLAREISYGVMRMKNALDHIGTQLSKHKKLSLKLKERILLHIATYQICYMTRIPSYAVADETVNLAKKYCHDSYARFLNAVIRKLADNPPELPPGETVPELSTRYSYPNFYVKELIKNYGLSKAREIMEAGNTPSRTMARVRDHDITKNELPTGIEIIAGTVGVLAIIESVKKYYPAVKRKSLETFGKHIAESGQDLSAIENDEDLQRLVVSIVDKVSSESRIEKIERWASFTINAATGMREFPEKDMMLHTFDQLSVFDLRVLEIGYTNRCIYKKMKSGEWYTYNSDVGKKYFNCSAQAYEIENSPSGEFWKDAPISSYVDASIKKLVSNGLVTEEQTVETRYGESDIDRDYLKSNFGVSFLSFFAENIPSMMADETNSSPRHP